MIRVLQIGTDDLRNAYEIPASVSWFFAGPGEAEEREAEAEGAFEAAIVTAPVAEQDTAVLLRSLMAHTLFFTEREYLPEHVRLKKQAVHISGEQLASFIEQLPLCFFRGQYGEKMYLRDASVSDGFTGEVTVEGNTALVLSGTFGEDWTPLLTLKKNIPAAPERPLELWPEYEVTEGEVHIGLNVKLYVAGYTDYLAEQVIEEVDGDAPLIVRAPEHSWMSISYEAYGHGTVRLGALHVRFSRMGAGAFLPGGKRFADAGRQEFFSYFDPMDMKPPLNVFFAGYRTAEGFEGYQMMRALGAPFLLISDPRVEGGAFYHGSAEYEEAVLICIKDAMEQLHFSAAELVLGGISMGSTGALYYGASLSPYAVIAGKPLVNTGAVAGNAMYVRPDEFATSLDVLKLATGDCSREACELYDRKMMQRLRESNYPDTIVAIAYMREDDYDAKAYETLTSILGERGARVYGKGITGRHNDDNEAVMSWFIGQYHSILESGFSRSYDL